MMQIDYYVIVLCDSMGIQKGREQMLHPYYKQIIPFDFLLLQHSFQYENGTLPPPKLKIPWMPMCYVL